MNEKKSIVESVDALVESEIKILPCYTNRASSLGDSCLRKLVYYRTNWKDAKKPDIGLQYIFNEGRDHEDKLTMKLLKAGIKLTRLQEPLFNEDLNLSGHPDGFVLNYADAEEYPYDIKSMSPTIFCSVNTIEDFEKKPWTKKYKAQLMAYMFMTGKKKGVFILVNKATGRLKEIWVDFDPEYWEAQAAKCRTVNKHVAEKTFPDKLQADPDCNDFCPFLHICAPDRVFKSPDFIKDPELEAKITRALELKPVAAEFKELDEEIKGVMKEGFGVGTVGEKKQAFVGSKEVTASWRVVKPHEVKGSASWTIKYGR